MFFFYEYRVEINDIDKTYVRKNSKKMPHHFCKVYPIMTKFVVKA